MPRRPRGAWLRDVSVIVVGLLAGGLLGLALFLASTDQQLVIAFRPNRPEAERFIIPVAGVLGGELTSSFGADRGGGEREHLGIDILAERHTPVLAATHGVVVAIDSGGPGGKSVYQRARDGRTMLYYAHLNAVRPGLRIGFYLRPGDEIGTVGSTGNARDDSPHLHFAVYTVTDPNDWRRGRHIDPIDLLR
ncbi:MAG: M23 family metallopeptidase [Longimicrobiales bacterium]